MTFEDFKSSLSQPAPPADMSAVLQALWHEANGNWELAHRIVQDDGSTDASWVHAYLHRKEGDLSNAGYWYARAGKSRADVPLAEEWEQIARSLIG